jgi:hypothetical protein
MKLNARIKRLEDYQNCDAQYWQTLAALWLPEERRFETVEEALDRTKIDPSRVKIYVHDDWPSADASELWLWTTTLSNDEAMRVGGAQNALKLLPNIVLSDIPLMRGDCGDDAGF